MKARYWTISLAALCVAFVLVAAIRRESLTTVWGDESTYLAMAESLARDGDLAFTADDAARLSERSVQRSTVILQRTDSGVAYSKPVLYALLAAPGAFFDVEIGPAVMNALLLLAAAWVGWLFLCRLGDRQRAALTMVTFVGASVLLAQVGWRMSDLAQAALSLAGLALVLAPLRPAATGESSWLDGRRAAWLGGLALGLLVTMRLSNALIPATALIALWLCGRRRRTLEVAGAAILGVVLMAAVSQAMLGSTNPYRAVRASFDSADGYPLSADDAVSERFETRPTTQRMTIVPNLRPRVSAYATLYFWIGRHTGLLWYFPAVLALLLTALRRPDRLSWIALLGAGAATGFYLIWWPENYFGGSAFLGNRYILAVYPLLLVALPRLPAGRSLAASWILAALVGGSSMLSLWNGDPADAYSQSHTRAGIFSRLPFESTARTIDGRRDRFWSRDLVRFVDSVPKVGQQSFILETGGETAELMIVTRSDEEPILLRYRTRAVGVELVVEDRAGERRFALSGGDQVAHGAVAVSLAGSWRRHQFPWNEEAEYQARTVRLRATASESEDRRVVLWYGGEQGILEQSFEYLVPEFQQPETAVAGSTTILSLRVRNMSPVPWASEGAFPVKLSYRMASLSDAGRPAFEGSRVELPQPLPSGDPVNLQMPVVWPETPGTYRLMIDLVIEDYTWFSDRLGEPIASLEVEVTAPDADL